MLISLVSSGHCIYSIVRHRASPYSYTPGASRELARFPSIRNEHILPGRPLPGSFLITEELMLFDIFFFNRYISGKPLGRATAKLSESQALCLQLTKIQMKNPSLRGSSQNQMESCLSALRSVGSYTGCDRGHPHDPASSHLDSSNGRRESAGFPPPQGCLSSFRDGSTLQGPDVEKNFGVKWCIAVKKQSQE